MHAANKVRESGYTDFDIYTPYPIHGLDKAMGVKKVNLTLYLICWSNVWIK